jgi:glycosyltransferase involved in cell wall biosynthesis
MVPTRKGAEFWALIPLTAPATYRLDLRADSRSHFLGSVAVVSQNDPEPWTGRCPRVAICMAAYQPRRDLFQRQIESLRHQSFADWICFVQDDGSNAESSRMIERTLACDSRFRYERNSENLGFYRNFERCLRRVPAGTDYVALADQDDVWHVDKLATLLEQLTVETMLAYSDLAIVSDTGEPLASTYWTQRPTNASDLGTQLITNSVTGAAMMFRRSLLSRVLPFPELVGQSNHDHWIASVALAMGRVRYIDRPLLDYVQHANNAIGHAGEQRRPLRRRLAKWLGALRPSDSVAYWQESHDIYFAQLWRVQMWARLLLLRCGPDLAQEKRLVLQRLADVDVRGAGPRWLVGRALAGLGCASTTLGAELSLLRALWWKTWSPRLSCPRLSQSGAHR